MEAVEPLFSTATPSHDDVKSLPRGRRPLLSPLKPPTALPQSISSPNHDTPKRTSPPTGLRLIDAKDPTPTTTPTTTPMTRKVPAAGPWEKQKTFQERIVFIGKRDPNSHRWDPAPHGASAGREGRQFAVANVGVNGKIYLKPSARPAHQRYPQPNLTFPVTPPGTSGVTAASRDDLPLPPQGTHHHAAQCTPSSRASSAIGDSTYLPDLSNPLRDMKRRRAMSDGTLQEPTPSQEPEPEPDAHGIGLAVSAPRSDHVERPKTTDTSTPAPGVPVLNICIPSWRLGTPRFTVRGTPLIRGPSYATTDEFRRSGASLADQAQRNLNSSIPTLGSTRLSHLAIPQPGLTRGPRARSLRLLRPTRSTYLSTHLVIEPAMFTNLTFQPTCDDRTTVRYSATGAVTAASAPRLVAEITSPTFLDYELISDFFLTFRSFLEPEILLQMLIARLRWALDRVDETGMIVRVRTFVAIRHWILNYFMDDFMLDYGLRVTFCTLLNTFADELAQDAKVRKVQLKILGELKKCWRRICAHYWDGPDFGEFLGVDAPIAPGGIPGNRDPNLGPSFWPNEASGGGDPRPEEAPPSKAAGLDADAAKMAGLSDFYSSSYRYGSRMPFEWESTDGIPLFCHRDPALPPTQSGAAHAATPASLLQPEPTSARAKTLASKRGRPAPAHLRNNSITDSLREHDLDNRPCFDDMDFISTLQSAGRLVRGNLFPPGQPYVDVEPDVYVGDLSRQTTLVRPQLRGMGKDRFLGGASSGYGVKKLIGSFRRALSGRGPWLSTSQPNYVGLTPVSNQGIVADGMPGTTVDPRGSSRRNGARQLMRIDLLGAEVAEDFKKAVREEEAAAEAERLGIPIPPKSAPAITRPQEYSAAYMDSTLFDYSPQDQNQRPVSDIGMTSGSELIVIVDDTMPFDSERLNRGIPPFRPSDEASADSFMAAGGDLTPPTTPPTQGAGGTPFRSAHAVHPRLNEPPLEPLPLFAPSTAALDRTRGPRPSDDANRPSFLAPHSSRNRRTPPISGGLSRMFGRNGSSAVPHSMNSEVPNYDSFACRISQQSPSQGIDAAADPSAPANDLDTPEPEPRFALRRRPGGDLRAITNVEELDVPISRRSQSGGSPTTYDESICSSYLLGLGAEEAQVDAAAGDADFLPERNSTFSAGQLTEKAAKDEPALIGARASKPVMRPSFEEEARKLAAISDDEDDDGGIESALLKLEGKYQPRRKKPSPESLESMAAALGDEAPSEFELGAIFSGTESHVYPETRHLQPHERALWILEGGDRRFSASEANSDLPDARTRPTPQTDSFLSEASHESYCSIPLLDRGLTDDDRSKRATTAWTDRSVFRFSDDEVSDQDDKGLNGMTEAGHFSFDFVEKTGSVKGLEVGRTAASGRGLQTFFDDASVAGSDLSSELSINGQEYDGNADEDAGLFTLPLQDVPTNSPPTAHPPHPFGDPITVSRSNSPAISMSLTQALEMMPERELCPSQIWATKPLPQTPDIPPLTPSFDELGSSSYGSPYTSGVPQSRSKKDADRYRKYSVHLPFILAFDSDILAQQFTLIEKDALNDIDWKDLIEMSWKDCNASDPRSWVDYLRNSDACGVEVVIARFNIMVKWAISEIVLTQHIEERAKCIVKFIHIAAHCRSYRNFATLAQLTIALTSTEVSRLSRTWELVPEYDVETLNELEALVTPTRNFYNLRAEMETGCDGGCIPFVGIYTHDLLYNAQRPSEVASSPTTPPLINFERYRIGAAVVKTLLRLLEASTRYTFRPIEGITERCLWMGALSDEEIRRRSESLE